MTRDFRVILEPDEGGYSVWVPALPGCVSQGDTAKEALANIREAIQAYVESAHRHGDSLPDQDSLVEMTVEVPV